MPLCESRKRRGAPPFETDDRRGLPPSTRPCGELVFPGETQVHFEAIEVVAYRLRKKLADKGLQVVTLRGLGYSLNDVSSLVRQGLLVRLWHGRYGDGATSKTLDAGPRHLLTARAVLAGMPRHALSHQTALLAWSLPVLRRDLDIVHVSGIDFDRPRRATGLWVHPAIDSAATTTRAGLHVASPSVAVAQTAALVGPRAGLMAADAGLRSRLFTRDALAAAVASVPRP